MKRLILILVSALFLISCETDPDPVFTTVRKVYDIEGSYKGEISLDCDSLMFHKTYSVTIMISSFSSEMLSVRNSLFVGSARPSVANTYHYEQASWVDINDCGQLASFVFSGTGTLEGEQLEENGRFILYLSGSKYNGKWSSKSTKLK